MNILFFSFLKAREHLLRRLGCKGDAQKNNSNDPNPSIGSNTSDLMMRPTELNKTNVCDTASQGNPMTTFDKNSAVSPKFYEDNDAENDLKDEEDPEQYLYEVNLVRMSEMSTRPSQVNNRESTATIDRFSIA